MEQGKEAEQAGRRGSDRGGEYLTVFLHGEAYGISILSVREIIGMTRVPPAPETSESVKGVITLRGKVIPVTDLRALFGLGHAEDTYRTSIVIVEVHSGRGRLPVGMIVDAVSEVVNIKDADVEETHCFGTPCKTDCILGIAGMAGTAVKLLDIDRVLGSEELNLFYAPRKSHSSQKNPRYKHRPNL
ncbi:MAG: chemotaxis protein CheW [Syntrophobacteraceae bacterium]